MLEWKGGCFFERLYREAGSNACLLHNLILYYDYLCSNSEEELYFEEINDMILRAKELKSINNYFLVPERNVNVDILLDTIKEKIKGCVR